MYRKAVIEKLARNHRMYEKEYLEKKDLLRESMIPFEAALHNEDFIAAKEYGSYIKDAVDVLIEYGQKLNDLEAEIRSVRDREYFSREDLTEYEMAEEERG